MKKTTLIILFIVAPFIGFAQTTNGFVQNADFEDTAADISPWTIQTSTGTTLTYTNNAADVHNGTQAAKITFDGTLANNGIKVWNNYTYTFASPIPETYTIGLKRFQKSADTSTDLQVIFIMHITGGGNKVFFQGWKANTTSYKEEVENRLLDDGTVDDVTYDSVEIYFRSRGGTAGSEVFFDYITTSLKDDLGDDVTLSVDKVSFKDDVEISLYPNPTSNRLTINSPRVIEKVEGFSMLGKKAFTSNSKSLDVSHLSDGMYLLKIYQEGNVISTKRFVKN